MENNDNVKLTKLAKCAGCGAKVGAGVLAGLLADIKVRTDPNLLVGFDKREIVEISEKIGTYEVSIQPFEDCCTIFVAKHPVTKPNLERIEKSELNLT